MKGLKRIAAIFLAVMMVAGTAFAANPEGKITVTSNDKVSVNHRQYTAYKILDATYSTITSADGTERQSIAYHVPDALKEFYNNYDAFKKDGKTVQEQVDASRLTSEPKSFDQIVIENLAKINIYDATNQDITNDANAMQTFVNAVYNYIFNTPVALTETAGGAGVFKMTRTGSNEKVEFANLVAGYYLIHDDTAPTNTDEDKKISAIMLDTVTNANVDIVVKATIPTPDKKIVGASSNGQVHRSDDNSVMDDSLTEHNNLTVGSTVNYEISQYVPNYAGYANYYFIINDKLSDGLTLLYPPAGNPTPEDGGDIEVWMDIDGDGKFEETIDYEFERHNGDYGDTVTKIPYTSEKLTKDEHYYLYTCNDNPNTNADGQTFRIAFKDIKNFPVGREVKVIFSARLNDNAVTGVDPNTNDAKINFSNNPSKSDGGKPEDQQVPGVPDDTTVHPLGEGPTDTTVTYTTQLDITKVDDQGTVLPGVQFTLTGKSSQVVIKKETTFDIDSVNGTYYLLTDGTYTETPPTSQKMISASAGAVSGYVKDSTYNKDDAVIVDGEIYRPYKPSQDTGEVFVLQHANDADYVNPTVRYSKVDNTTLNPEGEKPVEVNFVGETGADGKLSFERLGAGTYTLSETKVPDGYNKAEDITFTIQYNGIDETQIVTSQTKASWQIGTSSDDSNNKGIQYVASSGYFTVSIVNKSGLELPSTGGIGTTLFYAGGAVLVLLAGVLLVSKRRMA